MSNDIIFEPKEQVSASSKGGTTIPIRGIRFKESVWPDISLAPPKEAIAYNSLNINTVRKGMPVCVKKSKELQKYIYFVDWETSQGVYKLVPSHGNANTIFINEDKSDNAKEYMEYRQWLQRRSENVESYHYLNISLYNVSDNWLIHQLDALEQIMAQSI